MSLLWTGIAVFFAAHSISIVVEGWRDRMAERLGKWPWKGLYAFVSLVGLGLIVDGYALARQEPLLLWSSPAWLRGIALLLLLPVFPIFLSAYLPGRIKTAARHPILLSTLLWATAHLLVNGTVADASLFGAFLVWALLDWNSMRHRRQRPIPAAPESRANDGIALALGLGLYAAILFDLHARVIGVPVL